MGASQKSIKADSSISKTRGNTDSIPVGGMWKGVIVLILVS